MTSDSFAHIILKWHLQRTFNVMGYIWDFSTLPYIITAFLPASVPIEIDIEPISWSFTIRLCFFSSHIPLLVSRGDWKELHVSVTYDGPDVMPFIHTLICEATVRTT